MDGPGLVEGELTGRIIGAAIEVHEHLGPGLLESVYLRCRCHELSLREVSFRTQEAISVSYKGILLERAYRIDLLVEDRVVSSSSRWTGSPSSTRPSF